ncbi:MAG: type II toxin-antitoxin system PemK/MazF family toxin [Nanoarchaeota archaeon]|nr:type II toxin-antitoxin system PemK/MazF family toxin [Nanoarchaeota archaeon]MBU1501783.1 type II toxin-antitoxin system PemK/MazF family toxin [Nanoarchaeota archaeon]MBU2458929.1 type II toxin-antitoxin system PemK/MazF family toxin [Nanoarchaeota archaeon]
MKKDYKIWMPVKSEINNNELGPRGFKEREIWICNVGENIGFEEDGKGNDFTRPVLILKVFNRRFCYVIPLSKTEKRGKYYYEFNGNTGETSVALLSQLKAIDSVRLRDKVGFASKEDFEKIKKQMSELIFS